MGYTIEISANISKQQNLSALKELMMEKARNYNCINNYWFHETELNGKKYINNLIGCFSFDCDNTENANNFINYVKSNNGVHLECIYEDDVYKLLYVSSYYLKRMNKEYAKIYKSNKINKKYTTNEEILLKNFIKIGNVS
jgi:hypothetical protein|tara:strand:- start:467 stop:886 length:420 start_codon:yes stop_codon:yes gene_type:complete